jgi:hypothetical protein
LNLVYSIHAISQIPSSVATEKKEESTPFFRIVKQLGRRLDILCLPNKVSITLLGWAELLPLKDEILSLIAAQRSTIKSVTSLFKLPKFFIKQIQFYEACSNFKNSFTANVQNLDKTISNVKKLFFSSLSAMIAAFKFPQLLEQIRIVDLSKISKKLSMGLAQAECLSSLALYSMKFVDTAWTLHSHVKRENSPLSPKVAKTILKLGSSSINLLAHSLNATALFLGLCINPFILITVSTVSLCSSLASKIIRSSNLMWRTPSKSFGEAIASLPA